MTKIGIEKLGFYIPRHYLALSTLAHRNGIDPAKFSRGIGQELIAVPSHDEDIVTLGAEAARPVIDACGTDGIDTVLFATETGIDQSKAAGIYVHGLLGLPANCRCVELKQACYSATAALQMACGHVARKPDRKVLIIASDVSRYDLDSPAEATQGAGAVAMLVSSDPKVLEIDPWTGLFTQDIMDFWRPNYRKTPLVDGKYSALRYLSTMGEAWNDYVSQGGRAYEDLAQFCYHLPFSRMAQKAHRQLALLNKTSVDNEKCLPGMEYNRVIGNCYAASLYLSLISMLENTAADLSGQPVGLFSYGSGAVAEFFSGVVQPGYRDHLMVAHHKALIDERVELSYEDYLTLWHAPDPQDGSAVENPVAARGRYRLAKIDEHKRHYIDAQA
ncbi:hydroxymethylglutaryl-coenzyme A synthase [Actibacterium atlanticum]|uniref:Hydroxymethylglutaryl-coenzyme A synthase n=1 Tax=Actibacterium atlanticum TaxID=1461693 RepID=A0A058ZKM6_9RHOB|nr:hydroxymethylglutaryl-CoA synthase [Actibacterium atlanticum]KCV81750.1 hydroxymethylglutaryl-coenzyme A synthase [Actibacterium atlanticum]